MLGSGKRDDPIRPEFVPGPSAVPAHSGIVSWTFQLTDDNKMAIVQIVAPDRRAFDTIFQAIPSRPDIQVFEIGKDSKTTIENAIGKVKQGFSLKNFGVAAR